MANVNQIYLLVNDSAKEAIGGTAITAKDTGTLVSLGNQVLSSTENKDAFYKALTDRIGRTVIAVRAYAPKARAVKRDEMDWGIIYQKISFKLNNASENGTWNAVTQADPFDVEPQTEAVETLFSKMGTYTYEDSIPDTQLFTAFTSAERMGAFISGIYVNMDNALKLAEDNLANLAVNTYIAGALIKGKATQKRNLLKEYNTATGETLTVANCLRNADFLKFASREIKTVISNMEKFSVLYNASTDIPRFTPSDKLVVEILGQFASATASYLESNTYHKELVALPMYEEVAYWQGSGTSFSFNDVSTISIVNESLATVGNETGTITQSGVIAFVHDVDAVASIIMNRRSNSIYNPRAERFNIFEKADKGYAVDLTENGVVFYIADSE